jgi:16S rRNA processing protein RimM
VTSGALEVGRIAKSHGLKGDVLVSFTTDLIQERTAAGAEWQVNDTTYTVVSARPHQKYMLVQLAEVQGRESADALRGKLIYAEPLGESDMVFVHEVIGATVVDQHGVAHGQVVAVIDNPASDLMELADGRLIPFAFLVDQTGSIVNVDVPLGLLDDQAVSERD